MTYDSLLEQIQSYLDRADATTAAQYPNFIFLAQQRMVVDLDKNLGFQTFINGEFVEGENVVAKPSGWKRNVTLSYVNGDEDITPIDIRSYEYCTMYAPNPSVTGPPKFYSDYGFGNINITPTPDDTYEYEWVIMQLPPLLGDDTQTNWFTDNAPKALLDATVIEGLKYLKDYEQVAEWEKSYQDDIKSIQAQNDIRVTDRASDRSSTV